MQKLITCLCLCFVATVFCQTAESSNPTASNDSFEVQKQLTASTAIGIGALIRIQVFNDRIEVPALDFKVEFPSFSNEQLVNNWMVVSKSLSNVLIQAWQQDNTRKRIVEISLEYYRKKVVDSYNDSEFEQLFNEDLSNTSPESFFSKKPDKTGSYLYNDLRKSCLKEAEEKVTSRFMEKNKNDIPSTPNIDEKVSIEIDSGKVFNGRLFQIYPNRVKISGQWIPRSSMTLKSRAMFWKEDREEYSAFLLKNDDNLKNQITLLFKSDFSKALPKEMFKHGYIQKCAFDEETTLPPTSTMFDDWLSRQEWLKKFYNYVFYQVCLRFYGHYKYVYHVSHWMPVSVRNKLYYGIKNIYNLQGKSLYEWNIQLNESDLGIGKMALDELLMNYHGTVYGAEISYYDFSTAKFDSIVWTHSNMNNINGQWRGYQKCHLICDYTWRGRITQNWDFHNKELVIYFGVVRGLINGKEYILYDLSKCLAIPKHIDELEDNDKKAVNIYLNEMWK